MNAENFWLGWLKVTMIMVIVAGVFLAIFSGFANTQFLDAKINKVFLYGSNTGHQIESLKNWYTGLVGALMMGWGISMLYVVSHPLRKREQWAWRSIFYPVVVWYIIDSGISAYFGVIFNVVINTILFLQIMAPLLFLRNQLFEKIKTTT